MMIGNSQSAKALPYLLLLASILPAAASVARVDVGTAAYYGPPYQPTECYGGDPSQFPSSNLFAAAGDQIWDNGAACGRPYQVRCVNASQFHACVPGRTIQVMIVDYALSTTSAAAAYKQSVAGAALVLSQTAFGAIANPFRDSIRVEFQVSRSGPLPAAGLYGAGGAAANATVDGRRKGKRRAGEERWVARVLWGD